MALNYNQFLHIPNRCFLDKKLTKAFFLKNFDLSATEKKLLKEGIETMNWLGNIKTLNSNIPEETSEEYIYKEIQIMTCKISSGNKNKTWQAALELFQKYIPYHILLIIEDDLDFMVNTADKRINQVDRSKRTVNKYYSTPRINKLYKSKLTADFFEALSFENLDKTNLETAYTSYINAVIQYQVASHTGEFQSRRQKRTEEDMEQLQMIEFYEKEILELKGYLKNEDQFNKKLEFNEQIQLRKEEIKNLKTKLAEV